MSIDILERYIIILICVPILYINTMYLVPRNKMTLASDCSR